MSRNRVTIVKTSAHLTFYNHQPGFLHRSSIGGAAPSQHPLSHYADVMALSSVEKT